MQTEVVNTLPPEADQPARTNNPSAVALTSAIIATLSVRALDVKARVWLTDALSANLIGWTGHIGAGLDAAPNRRITFDPAEVTHFTCSVSTRIGLAATTEAKLIIGTARFIAAVIYAPTRKAGLSTRTVEVRTQINALSLFTRHARWACQGCTSVDTATIHARTCLIKAFVSNTGVDTKPEGTDGFTGAELPLV